MALLPPADAFDALLYHLRVPELWLQDGGLRTYNIPHYWFPGLVEGIYFWGLGLGSEITSHQIHFTYGLCVILLLWDWTQRLWGDLTAGWAVMLLISMPSLLLLATWAYTDLALIFFGLAMLYTLAYGQEQNDRRWWTLSAISAGMAMGVKYTSFVMPLTAVLLIAIWSFQRKRDLFTEILKFGLISAGTGLIWYLRNWIWMGNPIYPFLWGGRYWDEFRSIWYAGSGTGSGWDLGALLLLPLTITLGYQDVNSIDSDIGPLLLLLLPAALWAMTGIKKAEEPRKTTLATIGFFTLFSAAFWTYGYITTRNLWQTRLLLPAIVPFVIPAALGVASIRRLDTKKLRLSFIISGLVALAIYAETL
jgi:4-amino-4-deoxy-L-arabinose transferase-like glycosyltransferase